MSDANGLKKSEAIRYIKQMVEHYEDAKGKPRPTYEQFATAIINNLEGLGMTPPPYEPYPGSDHMVQFRRWKDEDA